MTDNLGWFAISGEALLDSLRRASEGENPDVIYAEVYANSTTEAPASTLTVESVKALAGALSSFFYVGHQGQQIAEALVDRGVVRVMGTTN